MPVCERFDIFVMQQQRTAKAKTVVHVMAGVVVDGADRELIARRADHRHQGGLWEYTGV